MGSAAGGGLPQWNCYCKNCQLARNGQLPPQLQSTIALSGDGKTWWLVNASPDLGAQIEKFTPLQPRAQDGVRSSPIAGVLLTDADIDYALGLLLMRNRSEPIPIYTSSDIRAQLSWLDPLMRRFCGIEWRHLPAQFVRLMDGIEFRGHDLSRSVAFQLRSTQNRRLLIAPAVSAISGELFDAMKTADAIFFDGTFWSNDELRAFRPSAKSATEMGHLPIEKSLPLLAETNAARKMYIHINNTNPILTPGSREQGIVEAAGVHAAYDGLAFDL